MLMKEYLIGQPLKEVPILEDRHFGTEQFDVWGEQNTSLACWHTQQTEVSAILPLPTDYPRPGQSRNRVAKLAFTLPAALVHELTSLSQQKDCSLYQAVLAAFE